MLRITATETANTGTCFCSFHRSRASGEIPHFDSPEIFNDAVAKKDVVEYPTEAPARRRERGKQWKRSVTKHTTTINPKV